MTEPSGRSAPGAHSPVPDATSPTARRMHDRAQAQQTRAAGAPEHDRTSGGCQTRSDPASDRRSAARPANAPRRRRPNPQQRRAFSRPLTRTWPPRGVLRLFERPAGNLRNRHLGGNLRNRGGQLGRLLKNPSFADASEVILHVRRHVVVSISNRRGRCPDPSGGDHPGHWSRSPRRSGRRRGRPTRR